MHFDESHGLEAKHRSTELWNDDDLCRAIESCMNGCGRFSELPQQLLIPQVIEDLLKLPGLENACITAPSRVLEVPFAVEAGKLKTVDMDRAHGCVCIVPRHYYNPPRDIDRFQKMAEMGMVEPEALFIGQLHRFLQQPEMRFLCIAELKDRSEGKMKVHVLLKSSETGDQATPGTVFDTMRKWRDRIIELLEPYKQQEATAIEKACSDADEKPITQDEQEIVDSIQRRIASEFLEMYKVGLYTTTIDVSQDNHWTKREVTEEITIGEE